MRYSDLFGKTKRDAPAAITNPAERLAYRAGLMRPVSSPVMAGRLWLPLGLVALKKLEAMFAREFLPERAQEIFTDINWGLGQISAELKSYKQLPVYLFEQSNERIAIAAIEPTQADCRRAAERLAAAVERVLNLLFGEVARAVDPGKYAAWYVLSEEGSVEFLRCTNGDYAAPPDFARVGKRLAAAQEPLRPVEPVATPHCDTIESLARFLNVPLQSTAKAVFYRSEEQTIFAVIRGDLQIDEAKLRQAAQAGELRFATEEEIRSVGAVPGYASPVGVQGAMIVADESIVETTNLVAGANREGYHLLNTNVPRDYKPDVVADIALARAGDPCLSCDGNLELKRVWWVGGSEFPGELDSTFLNQQGKAQKPWGVSMDVDVEDTLLAFIDRHHDDKGILWNDELAPFAVHVVALNAERPEVASALAKLTEMLDRAATDYLLDDRAESAGVKFNDADLIGLPTRITIGPRTVAQNAVEVKRRNEGQARTVPLEGLLTELWSNSKEPAIKSL